MKKKSIIWKIEDKKSQTAPSYLIGTMHLKDTRAFGRVEDMKKRIDACDMFASEFNLEEADQALMADALDFKDGTTLMSHLGEKKFKKYRKMIRKAYGLDIMFFNTSKPFLLMNIISSKIFADDRQESLDGELWTYAKEKQKTLLGVETFQDQIDIIHAIPLDYQFKQLKDIVKNVSSFRKNNLSLAQIYQEEDIYKIHKKGRKSLGAIRNLMLYDRNHKMAEKMARLIPETSACYAVGAGHLAGKEGLLRLLKKKGFKVKAV